MVVFNLAGGGGNEAASGEFYVSGKSMLMGNVGVGTTGPNFKMDVQQDITMSGDINPGTAQLSVGGTTTVGKRMLLGYDTNGNGFGFIKAGNYGVTWTPLSLQPNGGNVGIGSTAPVQKLDVTGSANVSSGYRIGNGATTGNYLRGNGSEFVSSAIQAGDLPTGSGNYIQNQNASAQTANYYISGNARVNSGMLLPFVNNGTLSVGGGSIGGTDAVIYAEDQSNSDWGIKIYKGAYDYGMNIDVANSATYGFRILGSGTERFRVEGDGDIATVGDIISNQDYGRGLVGIYSDTRYQNVFAMGTSWRLAANGTTPGNLYGLAWTHSNIGGESKSGLSHQLLVMENGSTKVALGSGIWTNWGVDAGGNGTYNRFRTWTELTNYHGIYSGLNGAHFYPNDGSYGSWRILGTRNGWGGIEFPSGAGNISLMIGQGGWGGMTTGMHANSYGWLWRFEHQTLYAAGMYDTDNTGYYINPASTSQLSYVLANNWFRPQGNTGLYWENWGGGWTMEDGTWIRTYGNKSVHINRSGYYAFHPYSPDYTVIYSICGTNGYWNGYFAGSDYSIYAQGYVYATTYGYLSTREAKKDIEKFDQKDYESALAFVDNLDLNYYKYKKDKEFQTTQVGFIAEETPGNLTTPGKTGVRYGELSIYNTGAIKVLKQRIENLEDKVKNLKDFGTEEIRNGISFINFSDDFKNQLNGINPVVMLSANETSTILNLKEVNEEGFKIENPNNDAVEFNWIAMAKIVLNEKKSDVYSAKFTQMIESAEFEAANKEHPKMPKWDEKPELPAGTEQYEDPSAPWSGKGTKVNDNQMSSQNLVTEPGNINIAPPPPTHEQAKQIDPQIAKNLLLEAEKNHVPVEENEHIKNTEKSYKNNFEANPSNGKAPE